MSGLSTPSPLQSINRRTFMINHSSLRSVYSTLRFGSYEPILDLLHSSSQDSFTQPDPPPPAVKFASALLSGALGAVVANPTDLVKIKLQSVLPSGASHSHPFTTALGGLRHIYRTEGVRRGLYYGGMFTTARAAVLTSAVIGSYDSIKNNLLKRHCGLQDGNALFVTCSMLAGVITTTAANPGR